MYTDAWRKAPCGDINGLPETGLSRAEATNEGQEEWQQALVEVPFIRTDSISVSRYQAQSWCH